MIYEPLTKILTKSIAHTSKYSQPAHQSLLTKASFQTFSMVLYDAPPATRMAPDSRRVAVRTEQWSRSRRTSTRESSRHADGSRQSDREGSRRERSRRPTQGELLAPRASHNTDRSRRESFRTPTQRQLEPARPHHGDSLRRSHTTREVTRRTVRPSSLPRISERPSRGSGREEVSIMEKMVIGIKRLIIPGHGESSRREPSRFSHHPAARRNTAAALMAPRRSINPFSRASRRHSGSFSFGKSLARPSWSRRDSLSSHFSDDFDSDRAPTPPPDRPGMRKYADVDPATGKIMGWGYATESYVARATEAAEKVHWGNDKGGKLQVQALRFKGPHREF
jgi:hypothetical protein